MAIRKVVTRSGRGFRGHYPSRKMHRMVSWESVLERDAILLFEFSPGVLAYREQPELILYPDGLEVRRYFPDFEITTTGEFSFHIEVKAADKLVRKKSAERYRAIATHYQIQSRSYQILTETEIRREPLFSNLKELDRHSRPCNGLEAAKARAAELLKCGPQPLGALGIDHPTAWRLLAHGHLRCDFSASISALTEVSLPGGRSDETLYF